MKPRAATTGVLVSGGVDSCALLARLLHEGNVQPFYVRCGLVWETVELPSLRAFLRAAATPRLAELVIFDLPLADLYGDHWSIAGRDVPDARTPDEAVYLPGRNALLCIKPAIWCAMHGVEELALATLAGNPFADATDEFFADFQRAMDRATGGRVTVRRPFARMEKKDVLRLEPDLPWERTFSCIAPVGGLHCGRCNKCAERQRAFRLAGFADPTHYNG